LTGTRVISSEHIAWEETMQSFAALAVGSREPLAGDDRELVALARTDDRAFAELYRRYLPRVYRYLLTFAATPEDAADLTQHVFTRALAALPEYESRGLPFVVWLIRIARNSATDAFRRRRSALPWDHLPENLQPVADQNPESAALAAESLNELRLLVGALPPGKQELLALRFAGGLTTREIAQVMGKSEEATRKALARTLHQLKEHYHAGQI
jgi:RNA polymerase sigma-70 factor, ECF subfamily